MLFKTQNYHQIQYLGDNGVTQDCIIALANLIQTHSELEFALLLSCDNYHGFVIQDHRENFYVIRSGFTSGYPGEGPKGLAKALVLLEKHQIEVEEINITSKLLNKLNQAILSDQDINTFFKTPAIRPLRLADYIYPFQEQLNKVRTLQSYYPLELPYAILDDRIFDLALLFKSDPDAALLKAYKRLEDIVRTRTGIKESNSKLFSQAFTLSTSPLTWNVPDKAEIVGRANLFIGTYQAFRNARAHRESIENKLQMYREFLLINELFILESEAINNLATSNTDT